MVILSQLLLSFLMYSNMILNVAYYIFLPFNDLLAKKPQILVSEVSGQQIIIWILISFIAKKIALPVIVTD